MLRYSRLCALCQEVIVIKDSKVCDDCESKYDPTQEWAQFAILESDDRARELLRNRKHEAVLETWIQ